MCVAPRFVTPRFVAWRVLVRKLRGKFWMIFCCLSCSVFPQKWRPKNPRKNPPQTPPRKPNTKIHDIFQARTTTLGLCNGARAMGVKLRQWEEVASSTHHRFQGRGVLEVVHASRRMHPLCKHHVWALGSLFAFLLSNFKQQKGVLSDSQKLPAGKLLFWGHFWQLITDFGAQIIILGNSHFGNFLVLVLGESVKSAKIGKKIPTNNSWQFIQVKNYLFKPENKYLGNLCGSDSN